LLLGCVIACSKSKDDVPAPPKPASGAPVVFEITKLTPAAAGQRHAGMAVARMYNFSEKTVGQYGVYVRYRDASGAIIPLGEGGDFEDFSFGGQGYLCAPKSWCEMKLDSLDVPAKTVTAEMVPSRVEALKDASHFEDKPIYELPGMEWPK
jgi:hypothetical protein